MKKSKIIILAIAIFLLSYCSVFATGVSDANKISIPTPYGYNPNDFQKMVTFLELTDDNGVKNGTKVNPNYSPYNPETWKIDTISGDGVTWTYLAPDMMRIQSIDFYRFKVVGNLDVSSFSSLKLLDCQATLITNIDLSYVPNLKTLIFTNTPISNIDLSGVPNLEYLSCLLTPISKLDLKYVPKLLNLECGNTQITNLDLEYVPKLVYLKCSATSISKLDLSKVPNLMTLSCGGSQISKLDLKYVPDLRGLECRRTQITSLDLAKVPKLFQLDYNNTQISDVDLSYLPKLMYLRCKNTPTRSLDLSKVPELEVLECDGTQITSLDLAHVPNLKQLSCSDTSISNIDLSKVPNLGHIECNNTQISSLDLKYLSKLSYLDCRNTPTKNLDLSKSPNIDILLCKNCKLNINELKNIKLNYSHLYKDNFQNQNILDNYISAKGDIKEFGNETSTYKWYIGDTLIDSISTSEYNLSDYIGEKVRCEITDGDVILKSNEAIVTGLAIANPPEKLVKGSKLKLYVRLNLPDIDSVVDKSVYWSVYNTKVSTIDIDGNLVISKDEMAEYIIVKATSQYDVDIYDQINIEIESINENTMKVVFDNPPEKLAKGSKVKLSAGLEIDGDDNTVDKSVYWSVYNTKISTIDIDGNLVISKNETSEYIIVRATSNYNSNKYSEIKIFIDLSCEDRLQKAINHAKDIIAKDNSTIKELVNTIINLSEEIEAFENNCGSV